MLFSTDEIEVVAGRRAPERGGFTWSWNEAGRVVSGSYKRFSLGLLPLNSFNAANGVDAISWVRGTPVGAALVDRLDHRCGIVVNNIWHVK